MNVNTTLRRVFRASVREDVFSLFMEMLETSDLESVSWIWKKKKKSTKNITEKHLNNDWNSLDSPSETPLEWNHASVIRHLLGRRSLEHLSIFCCFFFLFFFRAPWYVNAGLVFELETKSFLLRASFCQKQGGVTFPYEMSGLEWNYY